MAKDDAEKTGATIDVFVTDCGSIITFNPRSEQAKAWFAENVRSEGWQWLGGSLGVERQYAEMLRQGLYEAGFTVV